MPNVVTVEVWDPSYRHSKVALSKLPGAYAAISQSASIGLTLDDGEDDCVIVTVEPEFSTVTVLRDRTFYNLQIADDVEPVTIMVGGEDVVWPKGCLLPRSMGLQVMLESEDREAIWSRYTWLEQ